jgi:hypothetical protein
MVLERNNLSIIDSEKNGPGRIFSFNMLFAREFLHIFICLEGFFDVFFRGKLVYISNMDKGLLHVLKTEKGGGLHLYVT